MGKNYDRYVRKIADENKAKANVSAAEGGSSREHMAKVQRDHFNAHIDTQEAWDDVMRDPQG